MSIRLSLMFFLFLFASLAHAQDSLITAKKATIDSIMNVSKSKLTRETTATDTKLPINNFTNQDASVTIIYYDNDSVCVEAGCVYKTTDVDAVKKIINKRFDQQDDSHWLRKDGKVKAEMRVLNGWVAVKYTKV